MLDFYAPHIENGAETVENLKSELSVRFMFWDTLRDI
jgi:hypothetical protein